MIKSAILEEQKNQLQKEELAARLLHQSRNELYLKLRYLDLALGNLMLAPGTVSPGGTDGGVLYYAPDGLLDLYEQRGRAACTRLYLHVVLHCLFCHPFDRKGRDERIWNLACDVAVESMIDDLSLKCVHLAFGAFRKSVYARLRDRLPVLTAEGICQVIEGELTEAEINRWQMEFRMDDHSLWEREPKDGPKNPNPNRQKWDDIRERMETEVMLFSKEASEGEGDLKEQLRVSNRSRYDYKEFLQKFTVLHEEMQIDPDSFDYIFYHYGMELYGNMPLIEPLETSEVRKIEEFVIVIDTSMSCKEGLVKRFLEETYEVLSQTESFFKRMRIHIIQCDEQVQSDVLIESQEALKQYMEHFMVLGGGGTDFRPVFAYVEDQLAKKKFWRLRGLLYFTDGYGVFPVKMPPYETAFIFIQNHYRDVDVPPWAIKLILQESDLERR